MRSDEASGGCGNSELKPHSAEILKRELREELTKNIEL
jgi:hypothetical protein